MKKLSFASNPSPKLLLGALFDKKVSNYALSKPWLKNREDAFWLSRTAYSLELIALWQLKVRSKENLVIWLPDYFCNDALEPLRKLNVKLVFYLIDCHNLVDISELEKICVKEPPDIIIQVHFFGNPLITSPLQDLSKKYNALFVEDAAHALRASDDVGCQGDCVLYSPHKHFPIRDGAVLVVRKSGPSQLGSNKDSLVILNSLYDDYSKANESVFFLDALWILKRMIQYLGYKKPVKSGPIKKEIEKAVTQKLPPRFMSKLSRKLLGKLVFKIDKLADKRVENMQLWQSVLPDALLTANPLQKKTTHDPYLAMFSINETRVPTSIDMKAEGLSSMSWPDLPPEILKEPVRHKIPIQMRNNNLFFPIHNSLEPKDICRQMKQFNNEEIKNWSVRRIDRDEWNICLSLVEKQNLLQTWDYGSSKCTVIGWNIERLAITNTNGQVISIVQILHRRVGWLGRIAKISRGPLVLSPYFKDDRNFILILMAIIRYSKTVRWRVLQFSLEILPTKSIEDQLKSIGFCKQKGIAVGSGLIDLNLDVDVLYSRLNRTWKRTLKKISVDNISVRLEKLNDDRLEQILESQSNMQSVKGFKGIDGDLIQALSKLQSREFGFDIFVAEMIDCDGQVIELGYRVCLKHGNTATDFLLWLNEDGKKYSASTALYWQAIFHYKDLGYRWFDIGGLTENTTKGIAAYKKGLRSELYTLIGEWRYYNIPNPFWKIIEILQKKIISKL